MSPFLHPKDPSTAGQRSLVVARLKRWRFVWKDPADPGDPGLPIDYVRILCGRQACPGLLGETEHYLYGTADDDPWTDDDDPWELDYSRRVVPEHPYRITREYQYRGFPDTGYQVMGFGRKGHFARRNGRRVGRRPHRYDVELWDGRVLRGHCAHGPWSRSTIGQLPVLPCRISCPVCGTLNDVPMPSDKHLIA